MTAVRVASVSDLAGDTPLRVDVGAVPVCLARSNGDILAVGDTCTHAEVSLSEGEIEDGFVECWLHGSRFDLRTGRPFGLPATRPVPTYAVTIEGEDVLVDVEQTSMRET